MFLATLRRHRSGGESAKHFAFESKTICCRLGVSNRGSLGYVQTSVPIVPFRLPFWVLFLGYPSGSSNKYQTKDGPVPDKPSDQTSPCDQILEPLRKRSRIYTRRNKKRAENDIDIDEIFKIVNVQGRCTSLVISHDECLHNLWALYRHEFPCGHEFMEFTAQIPNK